MEIRAWARPFGVVIAPTESCQTLTPEAAERLAAAAACSDASPLIGASISNAFSAAVIAIKGNQSRRESISANEIEASFG